MRILVAEDDNTTAMLLSRVLRKAGHDVVRVSDGVAALELARVDSAFDAILTDWLMPNMDGVQFVQRMRREVAHLPPIIVVTAVASDEAREVILEAGADDYLAKPVQPQELLECLGRAAAKHNQTWVPPSQLELDSSRPPISSQTVAPLVLFTAGTGGPMALQKIFRALTRGEQACFVIVQQGPKWMLEAFTHRLQTRTSLHVALAEDGETLQPGQVRVAPGEVHCVVDAVKPQLRLVDTTAANYVKPSADVLFRSAARYGNRVIVVVLSGMGCDGAMGAEIVRMTGGRVLVQEPKLAEVASMPQTAVDHGKPDAVLPVEHMAKKIDEWIAEMQAQPVGGT